MEKWASKNYKNRVNFLCISCAGPELAVKMGQESKFQHVVNGVFTRQQDMPRWGQLGCNGLIILNENHEVMVPKTPAFLEVEGMAWKYVEDFLDKMLLENVKPTLVDKEVKEEMDYKTGG